MDGWMDEFGWINGQTLLIFTAVGEPFAHINSPTLTHYTTLHCTHSHTLPSARPRPRSEERSIKPKQEVARGERFSGCWNDSVAEGAPEVSALVDTLGKIFKLFCFSICFAPTPVSHCPE